MTTTHPLFRLLMGLCYSREGGGDAYVHQASYKFTVYMRENRNPPTLGVHIRLSLVS